MKRVILRVMMLVAMASAAVTMSVHTSSKEVKASEKGDAVVKYAKNFVGNRYRYGGSSLTKGTDCSGFTRGVYKKFGKRLPHSSSAQRRYGKKVKGEMCIRDRLRTWNQSKRNDRTFIDGKSKCIS